MKVSNNDLRAGAVICAVITLLLSLPLPRLFPSAVFIQSALPVTLASGLFWGVVSLAAILGGWKLYYQYFYPAWARLLSALGFILYAAIGVGLWWIAVHLPGNPRLWFILLGGVEGLAEHLFGIYALHILERVPWLKGVAIGPVLLFSFFEYTVYWSLVAWFAWGLSKIM